MDPIEQTLQYVNGARRCFGCGACAAACPKSALKMEPDAEGFAFPRIDFGLCVKCGACRRACLVNAPDRAADHDPEFYVARHPRKEIRMSSTSGGAFTAFSDVVLSRGGAVAGAVWSPDFSVYHTVAFDSAGRDAMRGSKYVQSDSSQVWREVRRLLGEGREVLFSGTPCQVAALYAFLGDRPANLTTVDFICHGTPSPQVFRAYLHDLETRSGARIVRVRCRDQRSGYVPMRIGVEFADGTSYVEDCERDPYFRLFLSGILNRRSCSGCPFTRVRRGSDLTIADNWRFVSFAPEWDDNTGVSSLLVNTERGAELLRAAETLEVKRCTLAEVDQHYLHCPGGEHPDRGLFFRAWRKHGFADAAADFLRPRPLYRRLRSRLLKIIRRFLRPAG
ncbi:MAG: Coenzyme F420 hydrogenase/dehydrogenase, beta subunit C-terminal domain [Lentisphaeria bacterium]|nr:Coenzyme F420 hydrogenase/dehydrogenase, beta subunit C-terminal domain [Lentisphaeria bacterium]